MDNYSEKREYDDRVEYCNEDGKYHRLDGPAVEGDDDDKYWLINGKYHRVDGPAIIWDDSHKWWYLYNKQINENKHRKYRDSIFGVNP